MQGKNLNIYLKLMGIDLEPWNEKQTYSFQRRIGKEQKNGKDVFVLQVERIEEGSSISRKLEVLQEEKNVSIHYIEQRENGHEDEIQYVQKDIIGEFTFEENEILLLLGQLVQEKDSKMEIQSINSILEMDPGTLELKTYDYRIFGTQKGISPKIKIK